MKTTILLFLMAVAAAAFTPTDVVIKDGAPLYASGMSGDDTSVVAALPFWTAVAAEPVGTPESPRTYCHVTLKAGDDGDMEWMDLGKIHVVARDDAPVCAAPEEGAAVMARLAAGDWVGEVRVVHAEVTGIWLEVVTREGARGWLETAWVDKD